MNRHVSYGILPLFLFASALSGQRVITTVAGTDFVFPAGPTPGLSAPLGQVSSLSADPAGNVYIADESNHVVLKYDTSGNITVFAGNSRPGFTGDGGYAQNASLNAPRGVATDNLGNVYIADTQNFRVRKVTPDGVINTIAGNGINAYAGEKIPAVQASIAEPLELATDKHGNVFVTDTSPRVRKISPDGIITSIAGNGVAGFSGDGGPATAAAFNGPIALVIDANDNLYISDWLNNRIRRVTTDGIVRTFAGTGEDARQHLVDGPVLQATFSNPRQLSFGPDGSLYVCDQGISRVRRISPAGIVTTVAGADGPLTANPGPATKVPLDSPDALTIDQAGNLYIGEEAGQRLRKVPASQIMTLVAGNNSLRASPNGGLATAAVLNTPRGITLDRNGHVFFSNTNDHRILELLDSQLYITAGNGLRGGGDGLPAYQAGLNFPVGIAFDSNNNLYIADQYDQLVRKVNTSGVISTVAGPADFAGQGAFPTGVTVDSSDNLYIVDRQSSRIRKLAPGAPGPTFFAGAGGRGYSGDNGPAPTALFSGPQGASTDSAGNLYIADTGNSVIRKVAVLPPGVPAGTAPIITTVAGTGKAGFSGDGGKATTAALNAPEGVWVDPGGVIYIADTGNNVVRQVTTDGVITTFAGTGLGAFFGDGGDPGAAALFNPSGIVGDGNGTFYIVDKSNNRIRSVSGTTPGFDADQNTLSFSAVAGAASPGAQTVNLECDINGVAYTISSDSTWLTASPAAGTMPAAIRVNVDPFSLAAGTYQGTVTVNAPLANPSAFMISVSLALSAPNPPKLEADPNTITLSTPEQAAPAQQTMFVANVGSGALTFDASPTSDRGWLKTSVQVNTAVPTSPGAVVIIGDPTGLTAGTYSGMVKVNSPTTGETATIPVTLNVLPSNKPKLLLSQTGLTFQGLACGSDPSCRSAFPQCFAVLNAGQGTLDVSVRTDVPWLTAQKQPCSRPSVSSVSTVPEVVVQPTSPLGPGKYEGNVIITSTQADNSPQTVHVVFVVLPPGTKVPPAVDPQGLVFIGTPAQTPGALDANLINFASQPLTFSATPAFDAGASNWFSGAPQSGKVPNSSASPVRIYPNFSGLAPGAYTGRITLQTDSGTQTVEIVAQVTGTLGATGATARAAVQCTPTKLNPVFTSVAPDFNAQAGLPFRVELYIVDDCGNPLTSGTAVASFNNGDAALTLVSLQNGSWSGTWMPTNVPASNRVEVKVRATSADSTALGEVSRSGNLQ